MGDNYGAFENRYGVLRNVGPTQKYFPRKDAEMEIRRRIDPVSYFLKQDTIELPTRHMVPHYVTLCPDHKKIYDEIEKEYLCTIYGKNLDGESLSGTVVVKYEIALRIRLIQVLNGFSNAIDEDDEKVVIELPWNPKVEYLDTLLPKLLEDPENKVIIWARFRWEINNLMKRYEKLYNPTKLYGNMGRKGRSESLAKWHDDPSCRIMLAHPKSAKYGFTWIHAIHNLYLSATEDFGDYSQTRERNHRIGQTKEVYEHKIVCKNTLEPKIWQSLVRRTKLDKFIKEFGVEDIKI